MNIVERLRRQGEFWPEGLANEAADEIERLHDEAEHQLYKRRDAEEEVERLRKSLQHIADLNPLCVGGIKVAIEAARAALKGDE